MFILFPNHYACSALFSPSLSGPRWLSGVSVRACTWPTFSPQCGYLVFQPQHVLGPPSPLGTLPGVSAMYLAHPHLWGWLPGVSAPVCTWPTLTSWGGYLVFQPQCVLGPPSPLGMVTCCFSPSVYLAHPHPWIWLPAVSALACTWPTLTPGCGYLVFQP